MNLKDIIYSKECLGKEVAFLKGLEANDYNFNPMALLTPSCMLIP